LVQLFKFFISVDEEVYFACNRFSVQGRQPYRNYLPCPVDAVRRMSYAFFLAIL
jgi:hypothetical protein